MREEMGERHTQKSGLNAAAQMLCAEAYGHAQAPCIRKKMQTVAGKN